MGKFKKILVVGITESQLEETYWDKIKDLADNLVLLSPEDTKLNEELSTTDALLVQFNKVDKDMIDAAPNLKYIGALATGVGKVDKEYAASKGIIVTNVPGY